MAHWLYADPSMRAASAGPFDDQVRVEATCLVDYNFGGLGCQAGSRLSRCVDIRAAEFRNCVVGQLCRFVGCLEGATTE
jgi:hypothetical protein